MITDIRDKLQNENYEVERPAVNQQRSLADDNCVEFKLYFHFKNCSVMLLYFGVFSWVEPVLSNKPNTSWSQNSSL